MRRRISHRLAPKDGFSLIELLVVIAIIAILAAIMYPLITSAKEAGRRSTCMSNQKQIVSSILMFAQDHDDRVPCAFFNQTKYAFGPNVPNQWKACIRTYVKNPRVFVCPSDPDRKKKVWEGVYSNLNEPNDNKASYRINNTLVRRVPSSMAESQADVDIPAIPYRLGSVVRASKLILICESQPHAGDEYNQVAAYVNKKEIVYAQIDHTMTNPNYCPVPFERHSGGANYGFADGHVAWMRWKETWKPSGVYDKPNYWNGWHLPAN